MLPRSPFASHSISTDPPLNFSHGRLAVDSDPPIWARADNSYEVLVSLPTGSELRTAWGWTEIIPQQGGEYLEKNGARKGNIVDISGTTWVRSPAFEGKGNRSVVAGDLIQILPWHSKPRAVEPPGPLDWGTEFLILNSYKATDRLIWIRILGAATGGSSGSGSGASGSGSGSGAACGTFDWEQIVETSGCGWIASGLTGDASFPACEAMGRDVPVGEIVLARIADDGASLRFAYCCGNECATSGDSSSGDSGSGDSGSGESGTSGSTTSGGSTLADCLACLERLCVTKDSNGNVTGVFYDSGGGILVEVPICGSSASGASGGSDISGNPSNDPGSGL